MKGPPYLGLPDLAKNNRGSPVEFEFQINNEYFFHLGHAYMEDFLFI